MMRRKGHTESSIRKGAMWRLDILVYCVSIAGMLVTLDQVRLIWVEHNAGGVSLFTWAFYTAASCVWLGYGHAHKDNVIFLTSCAWIVINGTVALGVMIYGA